MRALQQDLAAVQPDKTPRDRKAEAGAAVLAACGAVGLPELIEDVGLRLRGDALAGVAHYELEHVALHSRVDDDLAGVRELHCVPREVREDLTCTSPSGSKA